LKPLKLLEPLKGDGFEFGCAQKDGMVTVLRKMGLNLKKKNYFHVKPGFAS
jgi:hypothetical protein